MPKTKPKPPKKKPPPPRRPIPIRALPKPKKRMREAVHRQPIKKASIAMTADTPKVDEKDKAKDKAKDKGKTTEYPKGDIEKGRIDPEEVTVGQTAEMIAARDRRAYLLDQAEKNEAANDELNAIQVEQIKRVQLGQNIIQDPDEQREESMETAINALKQHDPDERKKQAEAAQKQQEKGASANPRYTQSPTTADFKQGQAAG
jgi:hypothetical protein